MVQGGLIVIGVTLFVRLSGVHNRESIGNGWGNYHTPMSDYPVHLHRMYGGGGQRTPFGLVNGVR